MAEFIKNPKNSYLFGALALFVTVYGPRLSPKLPQPIQNLFENAFFRASVMFLAIYVAQRDIMVSLVVTIVFMVLMNVVQTTNVFETFLQNYERNIENFQDLADGDLTASQIACQKTLNQYKDTAKIDPITTAAKEGGADFYWNKTLGQASSAQGTANVAQQVSDWCNLHKGKYVGSTTAGVNDACNDIVKSCNNQFKAGNRGPTQVSGDQVCNPVTVDKNWMVNNKKTPTDKLGYERQSANHGKPVTIRCAPSGYGTNCYKHPMSRLQKKTNLTKGSPNIRKSATLNPTGGCINSSPYSGPDHTSQCAHSGQCCGFKGANRKGAKCVKNDNVKDGDGDMYNNKQFCIDPNPDPNSPNPTALSDYKWLQPGDLRWSSEDGLEGASVIPPIATWGKNLDDDKFPNKSNVTFPTMYTDGEKIGRGCWTMNADPASETKIRSDLDANMIDLGNDIPSHTASLTQSYSSPSTLQNIPIRRRGSKPTPLEIKQARINDSGGAAIQGYHKDHQIESFVGSRNANYKDQLHQTNQINGAPVSSCSNYNKKSVNFAGTAFYPMNDTNNYQAQRGEGLPYSNTPVPYQGELY